MIDWILIGSCVLLLVVIAQLSIVYQKQSGQLYMRQEPLRKRVQSLRHKVSSSAEVVQFSAESSLKEIEFSVESLSHFDQVIGGAVEQLKADDVDQSLSSYCRVSIRALCWKTCSANAKR